MDRIIKNISEIETGAVKIMDDANAKKTEIFAQIQDEKKQFDRGVENETNDRIGELKERLEKDMNEKLAKQQETADTFLRQLDQHYKENHSDYVERLFLSMTGV